MNIKKATINELDSLAELFNLYRLFYKQESNRVGAEEFLRERFINNESVVFLAYDENNPVGFVQLYPSFSSVSMKKSWILNDLFVEESARKKGFAEQLIKASIILAEETGANVVSLETAKDNVNAQRLYEKMGFIRESNYFYRFSL